MDIDLRGDVQNIQYHKPILNLDLSPSREFDTDTIGSQGTLDPDLDDMIKIEACLEAGAKVLLMLYSFRSISRAIPDEVC